MARRLRRGELAYLIEAVSQGVGKAFVFNEYDTSCATTVQIGVIQSADPHYWKHPIRDGVQLALAREATKSSGLWTNRNVGVLVRATPAMSLAEAAIYANGVTHLERSILRRKDCRDEIFRIHQMLDRVHPALDSLAKGSEAMLSARERQKQIHDRKVAARRELDRCLSEFGVPFENWRSRKEGGVSTFISKEIGERVVSELEEAVGRMSRALSSAHENADIGTTAGDVDAN